MNAQTKIRNIIPWLLATIIAIVVLFPLNFITEDWLLFAPINLGMGISAVQAIAEFGGETATESFWPQWIAILASLILLFVIAPILWVNNASDDEKIWRRVGWYGGVSLVMVGFISISLGIINFTFKGDVNNHNLQLAEQSRIKDQMQSELATLQNRAMEQYWLPQEQGGVGGDISSINLADLKEDDAFENEFVLKGTPGDSSLLIYAVNERVGSDPNFENANQQQGRMQMAVKVFPDRLEIKMNRMRTDSVTN